MPRLPIASSSGHNAAAGPVAAGVTHPQRVPRPACFAFARRRRGRRRASGSVEHETRPMLALASPAFLVSSLQPLRVFSLCRPLVPQTALSTPSRARTRSPSHTHVAIIRRRRRRRRHHRSRTAVVALALALEVEQRPSPHSALDQIHLHQHATYLSALTRAP